MKNKEYNVIRVLILTLVLLIAVTAAYSLYVGKSSQKVRVFESGSDEVVLTVSNPEGKIL